jgi:carbonic anhydrase/acetyltransferase-like protein (isoleucine patch superfamily)
MKFALGDAAVETEGEDYYIAPSAVLIGGVRLGRNASVWWNAVLRADNEPIVVGERSNVQDGCVLHTDPGFPLTIGSNVTIGHMVMLHGCTIGDGTLVGIGSIILNGTKVGKNCVIGANTLLAENKDIPDNSLVVGSPGRVLRTLTDEQIEMVAGAAESYVKKIKRYRAELREQD